MTALSSADKLKLKISAARVERSKRQALTKWTPRKSGDKTSTIMDFGQGKPGREKLESYVFRDKVVLSPTSHDDKGELPTFEGSVRSMSGKLGNHSNAIAARVHSVSHTDKDSGVTTTQVVHYEPDGFDHPDKLLSGNGVAYVPKRANVGNEERQRSSPFKRVRSQPVIVRKGL